MNWNQLYSEKTVLMFHPWYGEFGWEIMTWAPRLRWIHRQVNPDKSIVTSFQGMSALYSDFAGFQAHLCQLRGLEYEKKFKLGEEAVYYKYGKPDKKYSILVHCRSLEHKKEINYQNWEKIFDVVKNLSVGVIGSKSDNYFGIGDDLRGIELQSLMNYMAGARCTVGVSSGTIHLASACNCPHLVWGDDKLYFNETLEKRYKEIWNPFNTKCEYIYGWQPEPSEILNKLGVFL